MNEPVFKGKAGGFQLVFDAGSSAAIEGDDHIRLGQVHLVLDAFQGDGALQVKVGERILAQHAVEALGYLVEQGEFFLVEGDVLPAEEEDALVFQGGEELLPCAGICSAVVAHYAVDSRQFGGGEVAADGKHAIADGHVDVNGAGAMVVHFQECFVEQAAAIPVVLVILDFRQGDGIFGDIREQGRLVYHLVFQLIEEIGVLVCRDDNQGDVAAVGFCDAGDIVAGGGARGAHDGNGSLNGLGDANGKEGCAALIGDAVCLEEGVFIHRAHQGVVAVAGGNDNVADALLLEHGDDIQRTFVIGVHIRG